MKLTIDDRDLVIEAAETLGCECRSYSGRGMYGAECLAIETEQSLAGFCLRLGAALGENCEDLVDDLASSVRQDSMGLGSVIYFPGLPPPNSDDDDNGNDAEDEAFEEE